MFNKKSKLIIDNLENGSHINIDDAEVLSKYNNTVFVFFSPNDISKLEMDLKNIIKAAAGVGYEIGYEDGKGDSENDDWY